jgi:hypothetical protein
MELLDDSGAREAHLSFDWTLVAALVWMLGTASCLDLNAQGFKCSTDDRCPDGYTCTNHLCWSGQPQGTGGAGTGGTGGGGSGGAAMDAGAEGPTMSAADMGADQTTGGCTETCADGRFCKSGRCLDTMLINGRQCEDDRQCKSGACAQIEGICCDRACVGQCEKCNSAGTCEMVTGQPAAPRSKCTGDSACGGSCNGSAPDCKYPTATKECRPKTCECGGTAAGIATSVGYCQSTEAATCDESSNTCPPIKTTACNGYSCNDVTKACNRDCTPGPDNAGCAATKTCCASTAGCPIIGQGHCNVCAISCG